MANNYSAQGSITIKRLRNGDSLFITLENNGIPLYQGVDPASGVPSPDWSQSANQPIVTPHVNSVRGNVVALSGHSWYYNSSTTPLIFSGTVVGEWTTDLTGKFQLNSTTGALKIIANLASLTNIANDSLTYKGTATVAGVEYPVEKSVDVLIQAMGASSYVGFIVASTEQLTSEVTTATLTTQLQLGADALSDYYVKWYKDNEEWTEKVGLKTITVTRGDVDGTQLFLAEFYNSVSDTEPVYRAGVRIIDTLDDFLIVCYISSANKEVSVGNPVTVGAKIVNQRTGSVVTPSSPTWRMDVMKKADWSVLKTASTNSIQVTTTETDDGGQENDVEVVAEVSWSD